MNGGAEVREVGPRDGLQGEEPWTVEQRVALIEALVACGLRAIEVGSFVRPDAVPSMAGTDRVLAALPRPDGVRYRALVPNRRGAASALAAGAHEVEVVVSVSDTHNRKNLGMGVDESVDHIAGIVALAADGATPVEAILAMSFGCPYEGPTAPDAVVALARRLRDVGVDTFSFADTTGAATPPMVTSLLDALDQAGWAAGEVALHLHDTRGLAAANILVATQHGVRRFDASVAGLGGCPYAPGATGNVATEDAVFLLDSLGLATGVDLPALIEVARGVEATLGRDLPSRVMRAGLPTPGP